LANGRKKVSNHRGMRMFMDEVTSMIKSIGSKHITVAQDVYRNLGLKECRTINANKLYNIVMYTQ
jgi:hypothetical protein